MKQTLVIVVVMLAGTALAHVAYHRYRREHEPRGMDTALRVQTLLTLFLVGYVASQPGAWR